MRTLIRAGGVASVGATEADLADLGPDPAAAVRAVLELRVGVERAEGDLLAIVVLVLLQTTAVLRSMMR